MRCMLLLNNQTEIPINRVRRENGLYDGEKLLHRIHLLHLGNSLQNRVENDQSKTDQNQKIEDEKNNR